MADRHAVGLVPISPRRHPHPCNNMTREVSLGDGAYSSVINPWFDGGVEWTLRYGNCEIVRFAAASLLSSYQYLLSDAITTTEAIRRLRVLRRATAAIEADHG